MIYKVMGNVKHNGKVLKKNSMVDFSEDEAKPLLGLGVIVDPEAKDDEEVETPKKANKKVDEDVDADADIDADVDADVDVDADADAEDDGLEAMTVPNLKKLAKKEDVEVTGNKADIVAAIRAARESNDDADKL